MKELEFINTIRQFSSDALQDDAAIIGDQVFTTDILVEGTHFTKKLGFLDLGSRVLAVNVSDIAAMGAVPRYYFVSLALPSQTTKKEVNEIYLGMDKVAKRYGLELKGGDLAGSEIIVINVLVVGEKQGRFLNRNTVELDDYVYTTGVLGRGRISNYQNEVMPRVEEGLQLAADQNITAATDISDGLAKSIFEMTAATHYGIKIENIPLAKGATEQDALQGGEDYELLFTSRNKVDYPFACYVGRVVNKETTPEYPLQGFDHFSQ